MFDKQNEPAKKREECLKRMFMNFSDNKSDNCGKYVNLIAIPSSLFCYLQDK